MGVPCPKPSHARRKPKRGSQTRITPKVREEVLRRSGGKCERCGRSQAYAFECAHLVSAAHLGRGDQAWNVALLCGPSVNSNTCHFFADHTKEGRQWRMNKRKELERYYGISE